MGPILDRSPLKQISLIVSMKTRQETQSTKKIHCAIAGLEDGGGFLPRNGVESGSSAGSQ